MWIELTEFWADAHWTIQTGLTICGLHFIVACTTRLIRGVEVMIVTAIITVRRLRAAGMVLLLKK